MSRSAYVQVSSWLIDVLPSGISAFDLDTVKMLMSIFVSAERRLLMIALALTDRSHCRTLIAAGPLASTNSSVSGSISKYVPIAHSERTSSHMRV